MTTLNCLPCVKYLVDSIDETAEGYLLTLVAITKSREIFDQQLLNFSTWLNDYSLGRSYKRKQEKLQIFGGVEQGPLNNKLHAHLIIKIHKKMTRSDQELNAFVRKSWIKLIGANPNYRSSLINFQRAYDLKSATKYALKEVRFRNSNNLLYI